MIEERYCDFHSHTTHSDGTYSPNELVALAKKENISCLAITDHDTVSGVSEAQAEGARIGVEIIPGIEISAQFERGTLHILGYFLDHRSKALCQKLEDIQQARRERNPQIIAKLNSLGMNITLDEVIAESGGEQVGRPHFARVLIKKGYVKDFEEAFDKYLTKGAPAYVDKRRFTSKESIEMINQAGGLAVLAHPKQMKLDDQPSRLEAEISRFKAEGMAGIEAYSSCQSKEEAASYIKLAEKYGLLVTGGSDFHGINRSQIPIGWMGDGVHLTYEVVDRMKKVILDRKMK